MEVVVHSETFKLGAAAADAALEVEEVELAPDCRYAVLSAAATREEHAFTVWSSARTFVQLLTASTELRADVAECRSVLELGAGTGILSLFLADRVGVHCTATDLAHVIPVLEDTFALNALRRSESAGALAAAPFCWGDAPSTLLSSSRQPYDCILATDAVFSAYLVGPLVRSIAQLAFVCELRMRCASLLEPAAAGGCRTRRRRCTVAAAEPTGGPDCGAAARQPHGAGAAAPFSTHPQGRCRVVMLNQLREVATQVEFETLASRWFKVRCNGVGRWMPALARSDFRVYRLRLRQGICAADVHLDEAELMRCAVPMRDSAVDALFCAICRGIACRSAEPTAGGAPLSSRAEAPLTALGADTADLDVGDLTAPTQPVREGAVGPASCLCCGADPAKSPPEPTASRRPPPRPTRGSVYNPLVLRMSGLDAISLV